ncbi:MAG: M15 family metallopeptidase [Elusimicrobia bacterium]|nr:M15 family metallopeptidase [Elusimicrobiota bacterium]
MSLIFHLPYPEPEDELLIKFPSDWLRDPSQICKVRKTVFPQLQKLLETARNEGVEIVVLSSYRTYEEQKELFKKAEEKHGKGQGIEWVAPAGYSEHHTGSVFDFADKKKPETDDEPSFESTQAFDWLIKHALNFGFELSFPKNNWQHIGYEPWHWRFVGDRESKEIFRPHFLKYFCKLIFSFFKAIILKYF